MKRNRISLATFVVLGRVAFGLLAPALSFIAAPNFALAQFAVLHTFPYTTVSPSDGAFPYGSLIQSGSTLYGMTSAAGTSGGGTIFQIGTNGSGFNLLHSFAFSDGTYPIGSLIQADSTLYGMTSRSGLSESGGTVFQTWTNHSGFCLLHSFA